MLKTTAYSLLILSSFALHGMEQETQEAKPVVNLADILKAPLPVKTLKAGQQIKVDEITQGIFDGMFVIDNNDDSKTNTKKFPGLPTDIYTLTSDSNLNTNYTLQCVSYTAHILMFKRILEPLNMNTETYLAKDYSLTIIYPWFTDNTSKKAFRLTEAYSSAVNPAYEEYKKRILHHATISTKIKELDITHLISNQRH